MGALLSVFSKKRNKTPIEHERQAAVFKEISENENVQWEDPLQRMSVIAGSEAAHRLSAYKAPPQDETDLAQYKEDSRKVCEAIDALKENKTGNMGEYKKAVQVVDEALTKFEEQRIQNSDNEQNDDSVDVNTDTQTNTNSNNNNKLFKLIINKSYSDDDLKTESPNLSENTTKDAQPAQNTKVTTLSLLSVHLQKDTEQKEEKRHSKVKKHRKRPSYKGFVIQVDQLNSQKDDNGVLNIKSSTFIENINEYHKNKRVTLTNSHNFLWFVTAVQSAAHSAERESEITRKSLDKILNVRCMQLYTTVHLSALQ